MAELKKIIKSKYFPIIALGIINLLVAYFYIKTPFYGCSDYSTYEEALKFIKTGECAVSPFNRLLTMPATLIVTMLLGSFLGGLGNGFVVLNLFFYFVILIVFYKLVFEIWQSPKIAALSTVLFQSNYWLFSYCAAYSADLGGLFFFILTNFLAVKYYLRKDKKYFYSAIFSSAVGVFFKEFGALGVVSLGMFILLSGFNWKRKVKELFEIGFLFGLFPAIYHLWFYFKFNYYYFNWYDINLEYGSDISAFNFLTMAKVLGWLFLAGWPIFLFSLGQIKKTFHASDYKIMLALLPASLSFFAWPMFMQRTAFVLVPWLAICSGYGLAQVKNKYIIGLVLLINLLVGYNMEILLKVINLPF